MLCKHGADVTIFSRDKPKLARAAKAISRQRASIEPTVAWTQLDVAGRHAVERVPDTSVMRRKRKPSLSYPALKAKWFAYFNEIT